MRRRDFITLLGGAAMAAPRIARAQQTTPVVGFMHSGTAAPFEGMVATFRQGLKEGGFIAGQNVAIEYRWAEGHADRLPTLAEELVRRKVNVIATFGGGSSNLAAKNATSAIPIVFNTGADPIKMGLVKSLNRPEGNITGVSFFAEELGSKELGLLHEIVPKATVTGLLTNPNNTESPRQAADTLAAAKTLGLKLEIVHAGTPAEIDKAFDALMERKAGALLILADAFYGGRMTQLIGLAAHHRLPTMYYRREYVDAGGLVSYGTNINDAYRQAGLYVAKILNGAKPSDLPIMQATKFEFVINLRTARLLGIEVPGLISARADDLIE